MTGTAMTEADEFVEIYKLDVVEIPTNVTVVRNDEDDEVYRTADEKYEPVAKLIEEARARGQPVLVGTTSIEKSELLSGMLKQQEDPARGAERALPRAGSARSSPRPARRARSRSPPTWPAAAPTSNSAATSTCG